MAEGAARVLVVDDEPGMREMLDVLLRRAGHAVDLESSGRRALARVEAEPPYDLVVTDLVIPGVDGMEVLEAAKRRSPVTQVIVVTAFATTETAVEALRRGAYDYVLKPFKVDELRLLAERAIEKRRLLAENLELRKRVAGRFEIEGIVGASPAMREVVELCRRLGPTKTNVLITGESGTGKELVARALHALGPRATGPFVVVNCGALPEALMESELFGHERGAFTGAVRRSEGLFREAEGGTLFLDEVGEIPPQVQVKLLRAIQERTVRPVGGTAELPIDVRILAASNRDLDLEVEAGRFRQDLFYRLNVVRIDIPPLRARRGDIPALVERFLARHAGEAGRPVPRFAPDALALLLDHRYPGNVRELENLVERAVALATGEVLGSDVLPPGLGRPAHSCTDAVDVPEGDVHLDAVLAEHERRLIERALERTGGNRTRAAELLGVTFRSLRYRLRKLGLEPPGDETV